VPVHVELDQIASLLHLDAGMAAQENVKLLRVADVVVNNSTREDVAALINRVLVLVVVREQPGVVALLSDCVEPVQ